MWLRVSKSGQDEQSQVRDNERWIESHRYDLKRTYTIHGKSAFKGNKKFDEAWEKVLSDIRDGIIKVLVVWKQDRLDRKLQTFQMLAQVVTAGGRVEFVTQPHLNDLSTMGGRISLKVAEEIAYAESKDRSDRILAKHAALKVKGSLIGKPPFGYSIEEIGGIKRLVPNKTGLTYVPDIFSRCIKGDSTDTIARWLTEQKVASRSGKLWNRTVVNKIIRNRTYAGYRINAQGVTDLECSPIIDMHTWNRANSALDSRPKRGPANAENRAMLALALKCANCDSPMYKSHRY
jgi:DNA invertase Pin-like site-specific DNA recombinase